MNADGDENEAETFGKSSAWVDYAGPATPDAIAGVAMFPLPDAAGIPWQDSAMALSVGEAYAIGARCLAYDGSSEEADVVSFFAAFSEGT